MSPTDQSERNVVGSVEELIGETPLLRLDGVAENLLGKVEAANPYSVKDRIARAMTDAAEAAGELPPGGTVVEATSGNTGIGLAMVSAARGYDCVLAMPESMSEERRTMLAGLGADLELTPAEEGMGGANRRAADLAAADDAVVAGVGTGGTITGVAEHFGEREGAVTTVAVEPESSPTLSATSSDGHDVQGIGPGFVPDVLRTELVDEVRSVTADDARTAARRLGREAGLLIGISSGAALSAAAGYARRHPVETTVVVLPDAGERYLSTDLFDA
ncbi:pyridoxal-phosphate dependent enzyme [Haloplanus salilacus]|uniref:pyridoxal-phosphate dependent enzyme n=1 Tax=Haloplanus salilacus TaxID=2949994 RepID=UPI0030CE2726